MSLEFSYQSYRFPTDDISKIPHYHSLNNYSYPVPTYHYPIVKDIQLCENIVFNDQTTHSMPVAEFHQYRNYFTRSGNQTDTGLAFSALEEVEKSLVAMQKTHDARSIEFSQIEQQKQAIQVQIARINDVSIPQLQTTTQEEERTAQEAIKAKQRAEAALLPAQQRAFELQQDIQAKKEAKTLLLQRLEQQRTKNEQIRALNVQLRQQQKDSRLTQQQEIQSIKDRQSREIASRADDLSAIRILLEKVVAAQGLSTATSTRTSATATPAHSSAATPVHSDDEKDEKDKRP